MVLIIYQLEPRFKQRLGIKSSEVIDFTSKAERRGIQRAATEILLNLAATNQEQHRPEDRFRVVTLPPVYHPPAKEVPLSLPLEPWKRPVERDTLEFSKKVAAYRRQKDLDYRLGRVRAANSLPGQPAAPINYNGPYVPANGTDKHKAAKDRLQLLAQYQEALAAAQDESPRPLLQQLLRRIIWYSNPESKNDPDIKSTPSSRLDQKDLDLLEELAGHSWDECAEEYTHDTFNGDPELVHLFKEFEQDLNDVMDQVPLWQAPIDPTIVIDDYIDLCAPIPYDPAITSATGMPLRELIQIMNNKSLALEGGKTHLWSEEEAHDFLRTMQSFTRIQ